MLKLISAVDRDSYAEVRSDKMPEKRYMLK